MKKKIFIILSLFILLIINSFTPFLNVNANDTSNSISTPITDENITIEKGVKYYDGKIFDYSTILNSNLNNASLYVENNKENLNYYLENYMYGGSNSYFNFSECVEFDYLGENSILNLVLKDHIINLENYDFNILKHNEDDGTYGLMLFERTIDKNIYFDNDIKKITFYINHFIGLYDLLLKFNDMFETSFELPLLKIDNVDYLGIKFNGKNNGFQLYSKNSVFDIVKTTNDKGNTIYLAQINISRVDYFKKITQTYFIDYLLSMYESQNISDEQLLKNRMFFAFDNSLSNKFYDYAFDIKSMNLKEKYFVVNQLSYSKIRLEDYSSLYEMSGSKFKSITFEIVYTKNTYNSQKPHLLCDGYKVDYPNYTCSVNNTSLNDGRTLNQVQLRGEYNVSIDNNIGYVDGLIKYVYFEDFEVPDLFNDYTFKVKSIEFYPMITGLGDLSSYTFSQDYTKVNYQKYTMKVKTSMDVFYFDYNEKSFIDVYQYIKNEVDNGFLNFAIDLFKGAEETANSILGYREIYVYQYLTFYFYFDEERTLKIPNVKQISFRYQKGFREPNLNDDYGFYYTNQGIKNMYDVSLKIDEKINNTKIDSYLSLSKNEKEDTYVFENIFNCNLKKDYSNYINAISPLEMYYETTEYETKKMVANSQGLHVIYDETGNANVYDGDGKLRTEYGAYFTEEGYAFPAQDLNNDGNYSKNEIVNSDTGILLNWGGLKEDSEDFFSKVEKKLNNFFNRLGEGFKKIGGIIALVLSIPLIILLFNYAIIPFFNLIGNLFSWFKNLFKKRK